MDSWLVGWLSGLTGAVIYLSIAQGRVVGKLDQIAEQLRDLSQTLAGEQLRREYHQHTPPHAQGPQTIVGQMQTGGGGGAVGGAVNDHRPA